MMHRNIGDMTFNELKDLMRETLKETAKKIDKYIDDTVDEIFDEYEKVKKEKEKEVNKQTEDKGISDFTRHMFETLEPYDKNFLGTILTAMSTKPKTISFELVEKRDADGDLVFTNNVIGFYFDSSMISDFHFYIYGAFFNKLCYNYGVKGTTKTPSGVEITNYKLTVPFYALYNYLTEVSE